MTGRHAVPTAQVPAATPAAVPAPDHGPEMPAPAPQPGTRQTARGPSSPVSLFNGVVLGLLTVSVVGLLMFELTHRPTYEYMTASPSDYSFDESMNKLGAQGWKTESCRRATSSSGYSASYECIMSRPKLGW